ncbi:hypothetical protein D0Z67_16940 [Streptomyces seoulensis]|uniref:Uncharacterized protein n=1 Tax=Streptomyces seoulensis TaxID=73044 RepID=A0A4P6TY92_STRSO|nr:hypothetical protein D0Z67_16940 [Streptomyces seoulensis]
MNAWELEAMRRAIVVSAQGLGSVSPDPPAGCVILDRGGWEDMLKVLGETGARSVLVVGDSDVPRLARSRGVWGTSVWSGDVCRRAEVG